MAAGGGAVAAPPPNPRGSGGGGPLLRAPPPPPGTAARVSPVHPTDELEPSSAQGGSDADACVCQGTAGLAASPAGPAWSAGGHQAALPPALICECHILSTAVTVLDGMFT
jgi:hypothetical protein